MTVLEALADEMRRLAREEARRAVMDAIRDLPGQQPRFTTIARYARSQGLGVSTLRRWCRSAGVTRQPSGRFLTAELDQVVARRGGPLAPPASDLAAERAKRAAASLRGVG